MKDSMKPMIKVAIVWIRFSDMCPKVGQKMSEKNFMLFNGQNNTCVEKKNYNRIEFSKYFIEV